MTTAQLPQKSPKKKRMPYWERRADSFAGAGVGELDRRYDDRATRSYEYADVTVKNHASHMRSQRRW